MAEAANAAQASATAGDIVCAANIAENPYKRDFPLLANHPDLVFLDSAATAQRPAAVLDAQRRFYEEMNANALRGLYRLSVEATEAIEIARQRVAMFIGAPDAHDIVLTRNASESLNIVAKAFAPTVLEPGDEVCITIMEHHSNLIPWQQACRAAGAKLVYLYPDENGVITPEEMDAKIGPKTKIVSVVHVSNVLGVKNPVEELGRRVHAQGGYLVVDGAQSTPHIHVDVQAIGADFFAFSAHKLFGPFGMGVLWGRDELLNAMPPFLTGGEMIDSVTEQDATWAPVPEKFEAGTQDAATAWTRWRSCPTSPSSAAPTPTCTTASSASTSTASTRTTWPASWTWTRWPSAPGTIARSHCSPGWASRTLPAAAPAWRSTTTRRTSTP